MDELDFYENCLAKMDNEEDDDILGGIVNVPIAFDPPPTQTNYVFCGSNIKTMLYMFCRIE